MVAIRSDRNVTYGSINDITEELRDAGASAFAAERLAQRHDRAHRQAR